MGFTVKMLRLMEEKGITVTELARMVGTRQSTIASMITRDSSRVSINLLIDIAHALGTTVDDLLSESDKTAQLYLSAEELRVVKAYRSASSDTKSAVCAVLGVQRETLSSDSQVDKTA